MAAAEADPRRAVCRVVVGNGQGTGFHWGGGWVMTNSHVLCGTDVMNPNVDMETISFHFHEGPVFTGQSRLAIVVPFNDKPDLALIKLGVQTEYARPESTYMEWEVAEKEALRTPEIPSLVTQDAEAVDQVAGLEVFAFHYGSYDAADPVTDLVVSERGSITAGSPDRFTHQSPTGPGSSGSPVFLWKQDGTNPIVGVTFRGDPGDPAVNHAVNLRLAIGGDTQGRELLDHMRMAMVRVSTLFAYQAAAEANGADAGVALTLNGVIQGQHDGLADLEADAGVYVLKPAMFAVREV